MLHVARASPLLHVARARSHLLETMKMIGVLCALVSCQVIVNGLLVREPGAGPASDNDKTPPLEGPAHDDNFQDEIVDQADHEFNMISGGDDCVSWEDMKNTFDAQFEEDEDTPDPVSLSDAEKEENEEIKAEMLENLKTCYGNADSDKDGCVNKAEFKASGEMEGPPPGFEENKLEDMSEEELTDEMLKEDRLEFDAMDDNKDGMISQTEAYEFADNNMPAADVNSDDLDEMFSTADINGDGFITFDEFEGAGQEIEGDGNEMENANPMPTSPPPGGINFKVFMLKRKISNERKKVTMKMLAHKPPLKFMASLLNRRK